MRPLQISEEFLRSPTSLQRMPMGLRLQVRRAQETMCFQHQLAKFRAERRLPILLQCRLTALSRSAMQAAQVFWTVAGYFHLMSGFQLQDKPKRCSNKICP